MAALTADINISILGSPIVAPFSANAADTFYQGALVYTDDGGGCQVTYAATADRVLGISPKQQTTAASGDIVEVLIFGAVWFPAITGVAATDEGMLLYVDASATSSDNIDDCDTTIGLTEAQHDMVVGQVMRYTASNTLVFFTPGLTGRAMAATVTNLWT